MNIWTKEQEGEELRKRFDALKKDRKTSRLIVNTVIHFSPLQQSRPVRDFFRPRFGDGIIFAQICSIAIDCCM